MSLSLQFRRRQDQGCKVVLGEVAWTRVCIGKSRG